MSTEKVAPARIASLDQFRGYTVAGMFLVNFLGGYAACPDLWRHHNTFNSYADTIMPQFFFAVGFSYRLSFGRRIQTEGLKSAYWHAVKRFLGLALVAILWYGAPMKDAANTWDALVQKGVWEAIKDPLKNTWFQTLMHIACTSLWILPVIRARALVRLLYMLGSAALHVGLSYWFYFHWVNGSPNGPGGIDGGNLGFLTWTIPTMIGTFACDAIAGSPGNRASAGTLSKMVLWSILLMGLGYVFSCGTRMYDVPQQETADGAPADAAETSQPERREDKPQLAAFPVMPSKGSRDVWWTSLRAGEWSKVLAEPPFVPPPHSRSAEEEAAGWSKYATKAYWLETPPPRGKDESAKYRLQNYWMMSQRAGSISYLMFSAGLSLAIYMLWYLLADVVGIKIGVFRTLGVNALFGYVLHDITGSTVSHFMPKDVPAWYMFAGFALFFYLTWLILRSLEKSKIYIKL